MNLGVSGEVVAYLSDPVVQGEIDDLLASAATPSSGLMSRLVSLGWKPDGEVAALLLGLNLFVHYYNKERDEYGTEIVIDNGKIVAKELDNDIIEATIEFCKKPDEMITEKTDAVVAGRMDAKIEKEKKSIFNKLAGWRKK